MTSTFPPDQQKGKYITTGTLQQAVVGPQQVVSWAVVVTSKHLARRVQVYRYRSARRPYDSTVKGTGVSAWCRRPQSRHLAPPKAQGTTWGCLPLRNIRSTGRRARGKFLQKLDFSAVATKAAAATTGTKSDILNARLRYGIFRRSTVS